MTMKTSHNTSLHRVSSHPLYQSMSVTPPVFQIPGLQYSRVRTTFNAAKNRIAPIASAKAIALHGIVCASTGEPSPIAKKMLTDAGAGILYASHQMAP